LFSVMPGRSRRRRYRTKTTLVKSGHSAMLPSPRPSRFLRYHEVNKKEVSRIQLCILLRNNFRRSTWRKSVDRYVDAPQKTDSWTLFKNLLSWFLKFWNFCKPVAKEKFKAMNSERRCRKCRLKFLKVKKHH